MAIWVNSGGAVVVDSGGLPINCAQCPCLEPFPCEDLSDLHGELPTFIVGQIQDINLVGVFCDSYEAAMTLEKAIFTGANTIAYGEGFNRMSVLILCADSALTMSAQLRVQPSRVLEFGPIDVSYPQLSASGVNTFTLPYASATGTSSCATFLGADPRLEVTITN